MTITQKTAARPIREDTFKDHQERMNRVMTYIQEHLDQPISLETLAGVACFSVFHFHRIFSAFTGETLSSYVRRIRLEQAANKLCHTKQSITDIALATGYETPAAFTRAFAQQFKQSPTNFRKKQLVRLVTHQQIIIKLKEVHMQPEFKKRKEVKALYVRRTGKYQTSAREAWEAVCNHAFPKGWVEPDAEFIGVSYDDPAITAEEKLRYDACITITKDIQPEGELGVLTVAGGNYAVFLHKGPYESLYQTYQSAYGGWLPTSGKKLRDAPCFEKYLNDCSKTAPADLLTEIYIPIE
jgi:AraC family transcriptional regulator